MLGGSQPGSQMDTVLMNILNRNRHRQFDKPSLNVTTVNSYYVGLLIAYKLSIQSHLVVIQGDTSGCAKPPVDFKTKVPFWPGLVLRNLMCRPVIGKFMVEK